MANRKTKAQPTSKSGNAAKLPVSRSRLIAEQFDWFDPVDFVEAKVDKLTKAELLELLHILNKQMIDSTENWDGG